MPYDDWIESFGTAVAGRYKVDQVIGRGGMAVVLAADDLLKGTRVALKVLTPDSARGESAARFDRERAILSELDHPGIIPILHSGSADGLPYYTMPLMEAGSLKDRLARGRQLPLSESLQIAADLGSALQHVHDRGFVHRDVKPSNILFGDSGMRLADFGVAGATGSDWTRHTGTGQHLGTTAYMSPEQLDGRQEVDGRSDLYSLAYVLFEMLAGEAPFGGSERSIATLKRSQPAPEVRVFRESTPECVNDAVRTGLQRAPADRFATVTDFLSALEQNRGESTPVPVALPNLPPWGAAMLVVALGLLALRILIPPPPLDPTRYVVLPFDTDVTLDVTVQQRLRGALAEWEGLTVVDPRLDRDPVSEFTEGYRIARRANAGRIVTGSVRQVDDSLAIHAFLLDASLDRSSDASLIREVEGTVPLSAADTSKAVDRLVEELLFEVAIAGPGVLQSGTHNVSARIEYGRGVVARDEWDLLEAERRFAAAVEADVDFELARVWKAQVGAWRGRPSEEWSVDARRAATAGDFPPLEHLLTMALTAMVEERFPAACDAYEELREQGTHDFAAWFGLGQCQGDDPLVVPDPLSPTRWSFRSSRHAASTAYRTALEHHLPAAYRAFGPGGFELVRNMLYAASDLETGRGPAPDFRVFHAFRQLDADTLSFVPFPRDSSSRYSDAKARRDALVEQRTVLLAVAEEWVRAFPESSDAHYTRAMARDLLDYPSALLDYEEALRLAEDPDVSGMIRISVAKSHVRHALPDDAEGLQEVVRIGRSLLDEPEPGRSDIIDGLADLALLMGRPGQAAALGRLEQVSEVEREAAALRAYAVTGGPVDSIQVISDRIERFIENSFRSDSDRDSQRQSGLEQSAYFAFPADTLEYLYDLPHLDPSPLARAINQLLVGSADSALSIAGQPSPQYRWDYVLGFAHFLLGAGDRSAALELLSTRLDSLATDDPADFGREQWGALVRASALRAELELELGSAGVASKWARAVEILWACGDRVTDSTRTRMREIAGGLESTRC